MLTVRIVSRRLLVTENNRVTKICQPEERTSPLATSSLRLEIVPECEEDIESEFSLVLASVLNDSVYLCKRGVPSLPFLLPVERKDTGVDIAVSVCERLHIRDAWKDKVR